MSRFNTLIAVMCGLAIGILFGLVLALWIAKPSSEIVEERDRWQETAKRLEVEHEASMQTAKRLEVERSTRKEPEPLQIGKGPLASMRRITRSEGMLDQFARSLQHDNVLTGHYSIQSNPCCEAHFNMLSVGEGKLACETVLLWVDDDDPAPIAQIISRTGYTANLRAAWVNRDKRVVAVAKAMNLDLNELDRLHFVLRMIPPFPERNASEGLLLILEKMPIRIRNAFAECFRYESDESLKMQLISDGRMLMGNGPAIGFPLSEKNVASVCFYPSEKCHFQDTRREEGTFSPSWTIAIHGTKAPEFTNVADKDGKLLVWPRLNHREIEDLVTKYRSRPIFEFSGK